MGTKRKRRGKPEAAGLLERARRELAKGKAKSALKDAKLCYRNDPSPPCRQLLEEAYLGRIQQLYGMRLLDEARAVLHELIELNPAVPEVCEQIPRFRLMLGCGEDSTRLLEQEPALLVEMADEAVLDPRCALPEHSQAKPQVEQVRQALLAVERGEDEAALRLVKEIPRSSPLCDWKLLVRGLSAFYQGDDARTDDNWQRLDPARPAWRIAQTLLVAAGRLRGDAAPVDVAPAVRRLESRLQAGAAGDWLRRLRDLWQQGLWKDFFREFRNFRQRFARSHAKLVEAIVEMCWKRAVRERDAWILDQVVRIGPPPPLDPRWNRARALLAENAAHPQVMPVIHHWTSYADDAEKLACLREEERSIAAGLVHLHLARRLFELAVESERSSPFVSSADDESAEQFRQYSARCYRKAIECSGQLVAAYHELARLHELADEPAKGAAVLRRLVAEKPDDYAAHIWLADYHIGRDAPDQSEPHVEAAVRLKPRDKRTAALRWNQRLAMVRGLVKKRQFEAARRELDEVAAHAPREIEPYTLDTIRAGIELKAKNEAGAQQHLDAALGKVDEPTVIWLQMSCTAARYSLPREVKKDFDDRFKEAISRKPSSATAGGVARFLAGLKAHQINYTGRATQERLFLKYLQRVQRGKGLSWQERDLCDACNFLSLLPQQRPLLGRLASAGVKRFPDCARLHLVVAQLEVEDGPWTCDFAKVRRHLQRALALAGKSGHRPDDQLAEHAQKLLILVEETEANFATGWMFGDEDDYDEYDEYDELDDDDDEYDELDDDDDDRGANGSPQGTWAGRPEDRPLGSMSREEALAAIERCLPPGFFDELSRAAQARGVTVEELLEEIVKQGPPPGSAAGGQRASGRRKQRR